VTDLEYAVPAQTLRRLAERHGVAIEREAVTFTGRCATCG
jgi:Fe2+ or Zn2+ uptake regulation protein